LANDSEANSAPVIVQIEVKIGANAPNPTATSSGDGANPTSNSFTNNEEGLANIINGVGSPELELIQRLIGSLKRKGADTLPLDTNGHVDDSLSREISIELTEPYVISGNVINGDLYGNSHPELVGFRVSHQHLTMNVNMQSSYTEIIFDIDHFWNDLREVTKQTTSDTNDVFIEISSLKLGSLSLAAVTSYVLWYLRGGVLMATLMSQLPTWRAIDPLPVLDSYKAKDLGKLKEMDEYFS
jgi:hypothetical protein